MNTDVEFFTRLIAKEAWKHKKIVIFVHLLTAVAFGLMAWNWPQVFTSSATVIVNDRAILRPLMAGTAVETGAMDPTRMARQIIGSRATITEILNKGEWLSKDATAAQIDLTIDNIRSRTKILSKGRNILEISFRDNEAQKAFATAKLMTSILIRESRLAKQKQSRSAFDFISGQAAEYRGKIKQAEAIIKTFREKNIDSTPGAKEAASERLLSLKAQIEEIDIELAGLNSKLVAQQNQMSGEGGTENTASIEREVALRDRIVSLKSKLEDLRLIYQDTYPDIVQINAQIQGLEKDIRREIRSRTVNGNIKVEALTDSPLALELRSEILKSKTDISTILSKRDRLSSLLEDVRLRINQISIVETQIEDLNREYRVNQSKHSELIQQRENARITMNIDIADEGERTRVEEHAALPANPKGIRFIHFILAGLILSVAFPIALVFGLALLDQKIRDQRIIANKLSLPILASVYSISSRTGRNQVFVKVFTVIFVFSLSWGLYGYEIWLRLQG